MSLTTSMREYLAALAEELIDVPDASDEVKLRDYRNTLWARMTQDERDYLNGLVDDIFGQWL